MNEEILSDVSEPEVRDVQVSPTPLPVHRPRSANPDYSLCPVLGFPLEQLSLNQPFLPLTNRDHIAFLRKHKIEHKSQIWISDENFRILATVDLESKPPKAMIHWLVQQSVVVNGDS